VLIIYYNDILLPHLLKLFRIEPIITHYTGYKSKLFYNKVRTITFEDKKGIIIETNN
jgi:hypothetical protein